jgi:teichuronic acid biosynthesis glycosyltransferase TuaH
MRKNTRVDLSGGRPADGPGLIVMCSGMSWDGPAMSHKHIATRLAQYAPVLFVDPPTSVLRVARDRALRPLLWRRRLVQVGPRLARLTPLSPPGVSRPGLRELAQWTSRRALGRTAKRLGGNTQAVIVGSFDNLFGACDEVVRVLYGTDDFAGGGDLMDLPTHWLQKQEQAQLNRANRIVAVSETLVARWSDMGYQVDFVPNGCDDRRYASIDSAPAATDITLPAPIAGIVGHLSERLDLDYVEAVADTGHSLLLVGPRQASFQPERMAALLARPNVQWVGAKPTEQMPSYLKAIKVGLTPYADSQFNRASFPLKTLEYLAAGRAAVSTDLPASRWLDTELLSICATPADFAATTRRLLESPDQPGSAEHRQEFASRHSWDRRVLQLLPLLGIAAPVASAD